jgi:hypothetical protein
MITESELLRRAVRWISDQRKDKPHAKTSLLINEAGMRFNLTPIQLDSLHRMLKNEETKE